jgi:hypothetical protein
MPVFATEAAKSGVALPRTGPKTEAKPSEAAMVSRSFEFHRICAHFLFWLCWLALIVPFSAQTRAAQEPPMHHDGMNMPMDMPTDLAAQARLEAKLRADKRESEFNHHLAGFFVLLAAVFMLLQPSLAGRWPAVKYIWPACFLLAGLFVLVWSDTELWPFGHRQWLEALQNNREVLQHKTFAVLLLVLGTIEAQRARGVLKNAWSTWAFPAVAVVGSVMLIFHHHEGGMVGEHHMETMARIQSQHLSYTLSGLAIGVSKGLSEIKSRTSRVFAVLWPLFMMILGVLLMFYRE